MEDGANNLPIVADDTNSAHEYQNNNYDRQPELTGVIIEEGGQHQPHRLPP